MNNEPTSPEGSSNAPLTTEPELAQLELPSHFGLIIGVLITILAVIFIGLYTWSYLLHEEAIAPGPTIERPTAAENNEPESTTAEAKTEVLNIVSTSDELYAIEADLNATAIGDIEADLQAVEAELGQ